MVDRRRIEIELPDTGIFRPEPEILEVPETAGSGTRVWAGVHAPECAGMPQSKAGDGHKMDTRRRPTGSVRRKSWF
jgi:hypothetical protein